VQLDNIRVDGPLWNYINLNPCLSTVAWKRIRPTLTPAKEAPIPSEQECVDSRVGVGVVAKRTIFVPAENRTLTSQPESNILLSYPEWHYHTRCIWFLTFWSNITSYRGRAKWPVRLTVIVRWNLRLTAASVPDDDDRDGPRNVGSIQMPYAAESPWRFRRIYWPRKLKNMHHCHYIKLKLPHNIINTPQRHTRDVKLKNGYRVLDRDKWSPSRSGRL